MTERQERPGSLTRVSALEAKRLVDDGSVYVDVRSTAEFDEAHPTGAYNVPILHAVAGAMVANADFVAVIRAHFSLDQRLVIGCRSGQRSQRACAELLAAGYTQVVDLRPGFDGVRDPFGRVTEQGWSRAGLPVNHGPDAERGYDALRRTK